MADDASGGAGGMLGGFSPMGLGMSLLPTLFKGAFSLFQGHKANQLAAQNIRPTEQVNGNFYDNQRIAQQQAQGLPSQVYNNQQNQIQRSESSAMSNINSRNMGVGAVGRVDQMATDQMGNLNAQNARAMVQGQGNLMHANTALAGAQQHAWNTNQMQPYQQKAAAIQALKGSSEQNAYGALNDIGSAGVMVARGNQPNHGYGQMAGGLMGMVGGGSGGSSGGFKFSAPSFGSQQDDVGSYGGGIFG